MKKRYVLKNKKRFYTFLTIIILLICSLVFSGTVYGYKNREYRVIQVKHGDTLWEIAQNFSNDSDIRKYIYDIKVLNKLSGSEIYAGTELILP